MPNLISKLEIDWCPHCSINSPNMIMGNRLETNNKRNNNHRHWATYTCNNCGGVVLACSEKNTGYITHMYPEQPKVNENIPQRPKEYLKQAIGSRHSPAASIMVAASAIDAMLKEKGYTRGKLFTRIKKAAKEHLITDEMAVWAHQVRLDANDQRHADEYAKLPTQKDAELVIEFTKALAHFLFVLPAMVTRGIEDSSTPTENK